MTQPTDRTRLRRTHERGSYDKADIHAILDATSQCAVGYVIDGKPYVTPTLHWREGNHVYWHGSSASRAIRASKGVEVCLTVQILDGYVLARSGFHHSANYRAVMIFGTAEEVTDPAEKEARLNRFIDGLWPGRSAGLRPAQAQELKATTLLRLEITEASAKVRRGGPVDDEADYALPIWAGVVPVRQVIDAPEADPRNQEGVALPARGIGFEQER
ncbi:pyridoxamine 5'-phosphate oxidase family protein [Fluviibacterium sp. DFM31]|uniref:Pyridoxamine 5'-phosphate oxidase family protein n=1 Tax=Meridianimarinicoccus marinus TaxID=3231483 RepID=A0ABV3L2W4_9RHOB